MAEDFMALYAKALEGLSTGGKKLEASLQEIEEGKKQAIAGGQQALIGGGLGGTTVMGAVPLAAEKTAARKRLGARGEAEQTYLTTLASFAAFSQRAQEAAKDRALAAQEGYYSRQSAEAMQMRGMPSGSTSYGASGFPDMFSIPGERPMGGVGDVSAGGGYAQQFPSIYGQEEQVPDWTGGVSAPPAGSPAALWQTGQWQGDQPMGADLFGTTFEWAGGQPTPTPQQVGMTGAMGSLPGQTSQTAQSSGSVWQTGDYAQWLRTTGRTNSAEALQAFNAAKGTPK